MSSPHDTGGLGSDAVEAQRLELIAAAISPELARLGEAMTSQGIPADQQLELLRLLHGIKAGSAWNGYTMARLQGRSRLEARQQPATAPLLAAVEFLGVDLPDDVRDKILGSDWRTFIL